MDGVSALSPSEWVCVGGPVTGGRLVESGSPWHPELRGWAPATVTLTWNRRVGKEWSCFYSLSSMYVELTFISTFNIWGL